MPLAMTAEGPVAAMPRHGGRRRFLERGLGSLAGLLLGGPAWAQLVDVIPHIKPAVVAVGTFQRARNPSFRFLGTGFAVGNGRLIATNAHVVPEALAEGGAETLAIAVPNEGGGAAAIRAARRVAQDKERDLAVLSIEGEALPPLSLAAAQTVREGQEIAFTGFPIGSVLGLSPVTHRGIVSAITPIVIPQARARELSPAQIRRLDKDPFRVYQLDATAYPGNSGSPVYDPADGQVIAILNMVFVKSTKEQILSDPSGISYAIPVAYLREMLQGLA